MGADSFEQDREGSADGSPSSDAIQTLFVIADEIAGERLLAATRGPGSIRLYSPIGATASDRPLVLWKAEEGVVCDIQITDELDSAVPAWRLAKVVPPLEFVSVDAWKDRPLRRDHLYRIRLTESGRPLMSVEHTFRTTKDGQKVGVVGDMPLGEAYALLT